MLAVQKNNVKYAEKIDELTGGTSFRFTGKIMDECERFEINFLHDNESEDIALHINPRFFENCVVRNTRTYEGWDNCEERRSAVPFPLTRGGKFDIQVFITGDCYVISINRQHFAKYNHRLSYEKIRFLEVEGDVEDVQVHRSQFHGYPRVQESVASFDARSSMVPCLII